MIAWVLGQPSELKSSAQPAEQMRATRVAGSEYLYRSEMKGIVIMAEMAAAPKVRWFQHANMTFGLSIAICLVIVVSTARESESSLLAALTSIYASVTVATSEWRKDDSFLGRRKLIQGLTTFYIVIFGYAFAEVLNGDRTDRLVNLAVFSMLSITLCVSARAYFVGREECESAAARNDIERRFREIECKEKKSAADRDSAKQQLLEIRGEIDKMSGRVGKMNELLELMPSKAVGWRARLVAGRESRQRRKFD